MADLLAMNILHNGLYFRDNYDHTNKLYLWKDNKLYYVTLNFILVTIK